jgi:hypothetical protein
LANVPTASGADAGGKPDDPLAEQGGCVVGVAVAKNNKRVGDFSRYTAHGDCVIEHTFLLLAEQSAGLIRRGAPAIASRSAPGGAQFASQGRCFQCGPVLEMLTDSSLA